MVGLFILILWGGVIFSVMWLAGQNAQLRQEVRHLQDQVEHLENQLDEQTSAGGDLLGRLIIVAIVIIVAILLLFGQSPT